MKVYIGYDPREHEASVAAVKSLLKVTNGRVEPELLCLPKLYAQGLLTRVRDERGSRDYDLVSNAHYSTRFNISRFLTPILCQGDFALFVDCDVVFVRDPREMLATVNERYAVNVVKHEHLPTRTVKMMGQAQNMYRRKNWSSVMLFNCSHPANHRLTLWDVNHRSREELHNFYWLHDDEICTLTLAWNWLVNEQPKPDNLGIAHFTNGGPFNEGWPGAPHDDLWLKARG
jgi:lipopolysaccharide biosynthesis glycosyltransferase